MEKNNNIRTLTNDLKAFEQMMQSQRKGTPIPEIEIEVDTDTDDEKDPSEDLNQGFRLIMGAVQQLGKAILKVKCLEDAYFGSEEDDDCDICPYGGDCGPSYGTMVLVARPDGDNTIITLEELAEEIGDLADGRTGTYDMKPIAGTEDLYYTIPEKKPLKRGGKTFFRGPAVIFGINEEAGEIASPNARQLYAAARYFEEHSKTIKTREGEFSVFCFN